MVELRQILCLVMGKAAKNIVFLLAGAAVFACLCLLLSFSNYFSINGGKEPENKTQVEDKTGKNNSGETASRESEDNKIVLAAVGDVMLSRNVEQKMISKNDWKYPFLETAEITRGADLAFGNLETTILEGNIVKTGSFSFRTDPNAIEGLQYAGLDVLSLANNHIMNFGRNGLESTIDNLNAAGIGHAGAGLGEEEIYRPVVKEIKGVRFGFLAYSYSNEQVADKKNGTYGVAGLDVEKMRSQVAELKKSTDVVVVSMHAGTEYETAPGRAQKDFARAAIDAGASLVIGHHPHVVQTAEKYNGGYILYSLGNFVFDQMWSEETRLGAIAEITFDKDKISKIDFVPVKIFDYAQPKLAEGADKEKILERLEAE